MLRVTITQAGKNPAERKVKNMAMKSKIHRFNPADYERNVELIPKKWVDHFNKQPRTIRCISDGKEEMDFFTKNGDRFLFGPTYWMTEDDDFTFYLRAIARDELLEAGKEYKLTDTYLEGDMEFGMVVIEGGPEYSDEWEGFHGFPAFLFEELDPVSVDERRANIKSYWESDEE